MLHFIACKGDKRHTQLRRYASQAEHQAKPPAARQMAVVARIRGIVGMVIL